MLELAIDGCRTLRVETMGDVAVLIIGREGGPMRIRLMGLSPEVIDGFRSADFETTLRDREERRRQLVARVLGAAVERGAR